MSEKHTPTPWVAETYGGKMIAVFPDEKDKSKYPVHSLFHIDHADNERERNEANAALIVRAVNSHEELIEALERVMNTDPVTDNYKKGDDSVYDDAMKALSNAKAE